MKDRITIYVCSNAIGDCTIKPMVIYHYENTIIFRRNEVMMSKLPFMWHSSPKS